MPPPSSPLPAKVAEALQRGNILEAIKLLRDSKGVGLKQAKDAIDEYLRGNPASGSPAANPTRLPPSVEQAMQGGSKIDAIKRMREQTGLGLKEAKDAVDAYRAQSPFMEGGSPGEVPKSSGAIWWVVVCAAAALGYYFWRGSNWV